MPDYLRFVTMLANGALGDASEAARRADELVLAASSDSLLP